MSKIVRNVLLAPYTTFQIGGPAEYFCRIENEEDLQETLAFTKERNLPVTILGDGSNVLISDKGVEGMVIKVAIKGIYLEDQVIHAGAGELWDDVVKYAVEKNLSGIECLSGIPGTVGGAPIQNIGAYGQELSETILQVRTVEIPTGNTVTFTRDECDLSYRDSIFKKRPGAYCVTGISLSLSKDPPKPSRYHDYRFSMPDGDITLEQIREAVIETRAKKGLSSKEGYESYKCAGSFFKAPVISKNEYEHIMQTAKELDPEKAEVLEPWHWEQENGTVKIAAGFLMEYTPFHKGYVKGQAGISPKHSLCLINMGRATAAEIVSLMNDIQKAVHGVFNITLEQEVRFLGF